LGPLSRHGLEGSEHCVFLSKLPSQPGKSQSFLLNMAYMPDIVSALSSRCRANTTQSNRMVIPERFPDISAYLRPTQNYNGLARNVQSSGAGGNLSRDRHAQWFLLKGARFDVQAH